MKGFKDFIMRGNLVELAVAFVIGAAFAAVVTAFTKIIVELLAKAGGAPNFDEWQPGGLVSVGPFLTALVAFLIMASSCTSSSSSPTRPPRRASRSRLTRLSTRRSPC